MVSRHSRILDLGKMSCESGASQPGDRHLLSLELSEDIVESLQRLANIEGIHMDALIERILKASITKS